MGRLGSVIGRGILGATIDMIEEARRRRRRRGRPVGPSPIGSKIRTIPVIKSGRGPRTASRSPVPFPVELR
jgi:hypothetical protein